MQALTIVGGGRMGSALVDMGGGTDVSWAVCTVSSK